MPFVSIATLDRIITIAVRHFVALAIPPLLLLSAARLLLTHEFLRFEYLRPGFPADLYGFTAADRLELGNIAIDYLFNGEGIEFLTTLRLSSERCWQASDDSNTCAMFTSTELGHMHDVKQLTQAAFRLGAVFAGILIAIAFLASYKSAYRFALLRGLRNGSALTLAGLLMLLTIAVASWNQAFDSFHELFFAAGTWRFPFSDTLIRLYPERLFVDAAMAIIVMIAIVATAILLITTYWSKRRR